MTAEVTPFDIAVPQSDIDDLSERLVRTRWAEREPVSDWSQGVPVDYLREFCRYWRQDYDWRAFEARLNSFSNFRTEIDGLDIHFLHIRSPEPDAFPVIMTHGWPGSVAEFLDVIGPLTDPVAHGGVASDAVHLVVPSLPGFGFSGKPTASGWTRERIADSWAVLMTRLGYERFGAQGGDWGASISNRLAHQHPDRVAGIHLNLLPTMPAPGQTVFTDDERAVLDLATKAFQESGRWEIGYRAQQSTRPQTLGYGLVDSPAGQCAWILEKFYAWTDCDNDPVAAFGADRLLDNIALYWYTATGASSARMYWESPPSPYNPRVTVPVGTTIFPRELARPFRPWAELTYPNICYWNEVERGGHFAAFEQPDIFVDEVRNFFRLVR
jgi:pimeloyl-ACP methyl ester carboxylesterase